MRDVLLIIHILAVAAWIGATAAQFMFVPPLMRAGGEAAKSWMVTFVRMGRAYYTPAAIVILATGVGLVLLESSPYDFEHAFVVIGVLMVLIGGALGGAYYAPRAREAATAFGSGNDSTGRAISTRIARVAIVEIVLLAVTVAAMVYRWGV